MVLTVSKPIIKRPHKNYNHSHDNFQNNIFYRSSGDTLTRENFYKLKNKLAEARLLTMQRRNSDSTQNVFGEDNESKSQASSLDSEEPAKGRFMVSWNRRNGIMWFKK